MSQPLIVTEFLELVRVSAAPKEERAIFELVAQKLQALGLSVMEDAAGHNIGGEAGNLIARLPGAPELPAILFSAHLDRVANHGKIQPQIEGDLIKSDGTSILGADDVAGICAILDGLRRIKAAGRPHGDVEIVFSVAEEIGLLGARHLDYSQFKAKVAYALDTSGPLETVVNEGPSQYTITVKIYGQSAHAGIEPEKGRSAIRAAALALAELPEGRLSAVTTSNFGSFHAGSVTNIVCDYAELKGEVRSRSLAELNDYLALVKEVFERNASNLGVRVELDFELEYQYFKVEETAKAALIAKRALKNMGLEANFQPTGGGTDGHVFNQNGLATLLLSPGFLAAHTPQETQSIAQLVAAGELVAELMYETTNTAP